MCLCLCCLSCQLENVLEWIKYLRHSNRKQSSSLCENFSKGESQGHFCQTNNNRFMTADNRRVFSVGFFFYFQSDKRSALVEWNILLEPLVGILSHQTCTNTCKFFITSSPTPLLLWIDVRNRALGAVYTGSSDKWHWDSNSMKDYTEYLTQTLLFGVVLTVNPYNCKQYKNKTESNKLKRGYCAFSYSKHRC